MSRVSSATPLSFSATRGGGYLVSRIYVAARAGMERVLGIRLRVDPFNDVNLALERPIIADGPKCRPHPASIRHRLQIQDDETGGVRVLGGNPHPENKRHQGMRRHPDINIRIAIASRRDRGGIVDLECDGTAFYVGKTLLIGFVLTDIVDVSVSRVGNGVEVEPTAEVQAMRSI